MSLEKPWEKPFEKLLQEFLRQYKGKISESGSKAELPSWGYDTSFFFYPSFYGEWKGQTFTIEISEFPAPGFSDFEAIDNIEYLRIFVVIPTPYSIVFTHKDWLCRLGKRLHLDREFQTGNGEFDRKYYVNLKSDEDKQLLMNSRFQEKVYGLEPFSVVQVLKSGVRWSQMITHEKQLQFLVVDDYFKKIFELSKIISTT